MILMVLIVPLWNWNVPSFARLSYVNKGSNRTFMELKFGNGTAVATISVF